MEAAAKRREEAKAQQRFLAKNPFRHFPTYDSVHADPWREQWRAQEDFDQMMKLREKEENARKATMGYVNGLAADMRDEINVVYGQANAAYREVRDLEDRVQAKFGPLPYLPITDHYWE